MQIITIPNLFFLFYQIKESDFIEIYILDDNIWKRQLVVDSIHYELENNIVDFRTVLASWNWAKKEGIKMLY
jgi:hypothetical protein